MRKLIKGEVVFLAGGASGLSGEYARGRHRTDAHAIAEKKDDILGVTSAAGKYQQERRQHSYHRGRRPCLQTRAASHVEYFPVCFCLPHACRLTLRKVTNSSAAVG